ncbi:hypothetical protein WA577_005625, partial [Blastocystis sp. JDR]
MSTYSGDKDYPFSVERMEEPYLSRRFAYGSTAPSLDKAFTSALSFPASSPLESCYPNHLYSPLFNQGSRDGTGSEHSHYYPRPTYRFSSASRSVYPFDYVNYQNGLCDPFVDSPHTNSGCFRFCGDPYSIAANPEGNNLDSPRSSGFSGPIDIPFQVTAPITDLECAVSAGEHSRLSSSSQDKSPSPGDSSSSIATTEKNSSVPPPHQGSVSKEIDVESVRNNKNKRLTVMIRNIPNRYSADDLSSVLDSYIANCYSIVSFPKDDFTNRNLGYAFITLTCNQALYRLIENMQDKPWPNSKSVKHCHICHSIDKKMKHRKRKGN